MIEVTPESQTTDNAGFQQISFPANRKNNISSLYHFMGDFREELIKTNILNSIDKISRNDRKTYIIELSKPESLLYEHLSLTSSHLSIDKYYDLSSKQSVRGFSFAHYTEKYENKDTQAEIIVHVYFDVMGKFCSIQIKKNGILQPEPDRQHYLRILENSELACKKLKQLIEQKNEKYIEAHKSAKELELRLEEAFKYKLSFAEYKKLAQQFLEHISIINRYADFEIDARSVRIHDILNQYQDIINLKTTNTNEFEIVEEPEDDQQAIDTKPNKKYKTNHQTIKVQKIEELKTSLFNLLERLNGIENEEKNVIKAIEQHNCTELLKKLMLELFFLQPEDSHIELETKKLLDNINKSIDKIVPLENLFKDKCISGKITTDEMELLFDKIKDNINVHYYLELLWGMIASPISESYVIKIHKFLLEKSHLFRSFIMLKNISSLAFIDNGLSISIALLACFNGKNQLFYELTNYKTDPGNDIAIIAGNKAINLLKVIIYLTNGNIIDIEKIKSTLYFLITASASLENVININLDDLLHFTSTSMQQPSGSYTIQYEKFKTACSYDIFNSQFNSYLEMFCDRVDIKNINIEIMQLLIAKSSFESIIRALSLFVNHPIVFNGYRQTINWGVHIAPTIKDLVGLVDYSDESERLMDLEQVPDLRIKDFDQPVDSDKKPAYDEQRPKALSMVIYLSKEPLDASEQDKNDRKRFFSLLHMFMETMVLKLKQEPALIDNILEQQSLYKKILKEIVFSNNDPDPKLAKHNKRAAASLITCCQFLLFQFLIKNNKSLNNKMFVEFMRIRYLYADANFKKEHYDVTSIECERLINLSKFFNHLEGHNLLDKILAKKEEAEQKQRLEEQRRAEMAEILISSRINYLFSSPEASTNEPLIAILEESTHNQSSSSNQGELQRRSNRPKKTI